MIFNKILSFVIILCCILFIIGFIPNAFIKEHVDPWSYYLLFLIPIFLFVIISRFNKINDIIGKRLSYIGIFSFISTPFLPMLLMFIFWNSSASLDGTPSLIVLGILPSIGIILSVYVSYRLWSFSAKNIIQPNLNSALDKE